MHFICPSLKYFCNAFWKNFLIWTFLVCIKCTHILKWFDIYLLLLSIHFIIIQWPHYSDHYARCMAGYFYIVLKQQQLNNDSYEISFMLFKDLPSLLERRSIATETLLSIAILHIHMCPYTTFLLIIFNFYLKYFSHTTNESYILFLVKISFYEMLTPHFYHLITICIFFLRKL